MVDVLTQIRWKIAAGEAIPAEVAAMLLNEIDRLEVEVEDLQAGTSIQPAHTAPRGGLLARLERNR